MSFGHGTTNAADEAAWLVLWKLGLPLDTDVSDEAHNLELPATQVASVQAFIEHRIASRKPAAYLTQEAWLQGVSFYIDERAIVPRSLIAEVLADGTIDAWLSDQTTRVLDLCTGNGSLAVLAALAWPEVQVIGADISDDALAVELAAVPGGRALALVAGGAVQRRVVAPEHRVRIIRRGVQRLGFRFRIGQRLEAAHRRLSLQRELLRLQGVELGFECLVGLLLLF